MAKLQKSSLHTLVARRHQKNRSTVVGIKVRVRAGVLLTAQGFLQSADLHGCSVRRESHIVEVRYRQEWRQRDKRRTNRRIRKDCDTEPRLIRGLICSLLSVGNRGRVATAADVIWWVSSGSRRSWMLFVELLAGSEICQSSRAYYLFGTSLKTQSNRPPYSTADMHTDVNADQENARGRSRLHFSCM